MSPAAEKIIERLDAARQKWWLCSLLSTTVLAGSLSFGVFLAMMLADSLLRFSHGWLLGLSLTWLGITAMLMLAVGRRLLGGHRSIEAAARRVEAELPELGSELINLVQLSEDRVNTNQAFCQAAVNQAAAALGNVAFERAAAKEPRWRRFRHCMQTPRDLAEAVLVLAIIGGVAVICDRAIPNWGSAASRLLRPWSFVPSVGSVQIVRVAPGNTEVLLGDSVEITAEIRNPDDRPYRALLFAASGKREETPTVMAADQQHQCYKATISSVVEATHYRLEIGDSQTEVYNIRVREKPLIEAAEVTFRYPAYLGQSTSTAKTKDLDLEAPQYTVAELRLRPSTRIARGNIELDGRGYAGRVEDDGRLLVCSIPLLKNGSYTVRLMDDAAHSDPSPRLNRIRVLSDRPPTVELVKPARRSGAARGMEIPITIRAGDDHGIGRIELQTRLRSGGAAAKDAERDAEGAQGETVTTVKQWTDFAGDSITTGVRHYRLRLLPIPAKAGTTIKAPAKAGTKNDGPAKGGTNNGRPTEAGDLNVKPGQTLLVRAVVWDKRAVGEWGLNLQPQEAATDWHAITIADSDAAATAAVEELETLRAAIWKMLEKQLSARTAAATVLKNGQLAQRTAAAADIRTRQIEIQKTSVDLVGTIGPTENKDRLTIKKVLGRLAFGEMLQAVAACDAMARLAAPDEFKRPVHALTACQDQIIETLRKLLDLVHHAEADALAEMKKRSGGNLPDDARQKLEEIRARLDRFLKQQKKVIEASENLAKMPVEDFTKKEEELLKKLAAAEDDWAKFMGEIHSDLSKLPEQDFANPSTAKELVEIQTELKMAEDALTKKSVDIAVPLEQLSYERAEELKTNLEKWLPDSPDREKWSQEESLTDKDKEAPMAELPGELEDMVGNLMEQEEDLFDEMEDVSSSAADSLDKGAGWDAMDGPISNNSAKGVTGNRLPNTSEIAGRSGEGRQGKASGEMVGDEAVGKGGRRTPSRLTPDPYVKGQIKDHSKEAARGATGGGKESGKGGEGLQGPVPRSPGIRDAARLADKQAALRNKAEGVDVKLQVANFHHTDLKKLLEIMAQVERDLRSGRYQDALRQRDLLLEGLGNVKQYLRGEFEVRQDKSVNLPADIQKQILGSMHDPSPSGWEELNRRYYERLSGSGTQADARPSKKQ